MIYRLINKVLDWFDPPKPNPRDYFINRFIDMDDEARKRWRKQLEACTAFNNHCEDKTKRRRNMEQNWDGYGLSDSPIITTDSDVNKERQKRRVKKSKYTKTRKVGGSHEVYDSHLGAWIVLSCIDDNDLYENSSQYSSGSSSSYSGSSSSSYDSDYSSSSSDSSGCSSSSSSCSGGSFD